MCSAHFLATPHPAIIVHSFVRYQFEYYLSEHKLSNVHFIKEENPTKFSWYETCYNKHELLSCPYCTSSCHIMEIPIPSLKYRNLSSGVIPYLSLPALQIHFSSSFFANTFATANKQMLFTNKNKQLCCFLAFFPFQCTMKS